MDREVKQRRSINTKFNTREDESGDKFISGYFVVFGSNYELWPGATESVDRGAFDNALEDDIRCLTDHVTHLVLGRTKAETLTLRADEHGLFGEVKINEKDQDAVNTYERVKRGDVSQCSFGFDILDEEFTEDRETGEVHWTIKAVKLYEVSVVTFPAYEDTGVTARKAEYDAIQKRKRDKWEIDIKRKLKGETNGN